MENSEEGTDGSWGQGSFPVGECIQSLGGTQMGGFSGAEKKVWGELGVLTARSALRKDSRGGVVPADHPAPDVLEPSLGLRVGLPDLEALMCLSKPSWTGSEI